MYKCTYKVTLKAILESFQIRPNLRVVVTNIALHGLEITTDKCVFCDAEKETLASFLCLYQSCFFLEIM